MKRARALLVPLALVVAASCGGGESSLDAILQGDLAPATDGEGSPSDESAPSESDRARADDGSSTPVGIPGGAEAYCRLARSVDDSADGINEVLDTFTFDADVIRDAFDEARRALAELANVAPDEIRGDIRTFGEGFGELFAELEAVEFNFFALDFEALEQLSERFDEADERIQEYNERVCGIARTTFDDEFGDFGELDDLDLSELQDAFGELGDMFGDLEDFDMGDFGSFFVDALTEQYISEGYDPVDARCIAEATFDPNWVFDAMRSADPAEAFENLEDPFTRCGVTPRD